MADKEILEQHILNANAFEEETPETAPPPAAQQHESARTSMTTANEDVVYPSTSYGSRLNRYKSTSSSIRRTGDVDALVQILSRRTIATQSDIESNADYQPELEEIMGGIFGRSDDDISKQKNVGVIWKHLTVFPFPTRLSALLMHVGQRCRRRSNYQRNIWWNILASLPEIVYGDFPSKSRGKYPAHSATGLLGMC